MRIGRKVLCRTKSKRPLSELKAYQVTHLVEDAARAKAQLNMCLGDESREDVLS